MTSILTRPHDVSVNGDGLHHVILHNANARYSMLNETRKSLDLLLQFARSQIPHECLSTIRKVNFRTANTGSPYFPCPLKETEAVSALKAVEAGIASSIADLALGRKERKAAVDLERASAFLFSAYLSTVGGMNKQHPQVKSLLKDTDLLQAQSILYRRLAANLYETKIAGEYYHIHGSLEATSTLNMIGLEGHRPDVTGYKQAINLIEKHVKKYTATELDVMNLQRKQAGVQALKWDEFRKSAHGQVLVREPPWTVDAIENFSPPVAFPCCLSPAPKPQILSGIRVLELCRIIAGPSIGRGLAEYGADVIKVTSPSLSDVPFFQVDGNLGKHTIDLDLKNPEQRRAFEELLQTADVVLDGYRPGSLERLGYGPTQLIELTKHRGRGIVYVAENCFGHMGEWAGRAGWQQIADCVTGVAWAQGLSMGLNEPVVPPFPMSDYGTGCMGTIAALTGLYKRAKSGGSYICKTSLCQYDIFLLKLGFYPDAILQGLRRTHDSDFYELRHHDSVDEVGKRALKSMRRTHPELFENKYLHQAYSRGFQAPVKYVRPVVELEGTWNGYVRSSRPNGFDEPTWEGWEVDDEMIKA